MNIGNCLKISIQAYIKTLREKAEEVKDWKIHNTQKVELGSSTVRQLLQESYECFEKSEYIYKSVAKDLEKILNEYDELVKQLENSGYNRE